MTQDIACWDVFETDITNPNTYTNPFEDVTLNTVFKSPQGNITPFWGFYNNNTTWTLRFMPNQVGTWTYEATFSDGTPGIQGQFECVSSDIPGLLHKHESNPIWFGFKDGQHFLPRSFHIGDCFFADEPNTVTGAQWNPNMRTKFLNWVQEQNYNMLSIASHYLNRQSDDRGNGWQTPDLWHTDAQIPRPSEYTRMEKVLTDLAKRKILVYPFAGLFGRDANYPTDHAKQEIYMRYTLARLAPYWNLLFMVGGPEPHMQKGRYLSGEDINRIGRRIQALDPFGHLLSVHNPTGDDFFRHEAWVSYIILQGPKTIDRKKLGKDHLRNSHPNKPLYAQETLWPGNTLHSKRIGHDYTPADIRKNAFVMLFSAAAINFADMDGLSSSGFSGRPDLTLTKQPIHDIIQNVWNTFETFPFYQLRPQQALVNNGYCLASEDHQRILVYLDSPGNLQVNVEGQYRAEWINAQNATEHIELGEIIPKTSLQTPEGNDDWILDLTRVGDDVADQIHLSYSENPANSLTVTWHTKSPDVVSQVQICKPGKNWQTVAGNSFPSPHTGTLHRVIINDLTPNTQYDYRVTNGPLYRTHTMASGPSDYTFAFICDTGLIGRPDGNTTGTRQIINEVLKDRPDFILGGGDYAYGNKDGRFEKMGDAIDTWFLQWQDVLAQFPFYAQYGNHEIHLEERFEDWAPRFAHPNGFDNNRNYSFDIGSAHYTSIFLPRNTLTEEQLVWIETDLATARQKGTPFLIVFQHEAIYGHGTSHPARPENRAALAPIFERHAVDLHLSCHDQNYERTFPLTEVPDNPTPGATDLHHYAQGQGVIYAKISPGGKMSEIGNQFSQFTTEQQDFMAVRDCTTHHYALVHLRSKGEIEVEVFSLTGDGTPKTRLDAFTITS